MDASAIDCELATSRRIHASRDKVWSALTEHGAETEVHWRQTFATADDCAALRASERAESRSSGCRRGETAALIGDIPEQR